MSSRNPLFLLATTLAIATPSQALSNDIVPDGASATTVSVGANGRTLVELAPPHAGVSHNSYADFNVGSPGVDLVNTHARARYIVNEVTSTRRSFIEGPVSVVGPRANVILANPNGISINGASFTNTGSVALTTGRVSFNDFSLAPTLSQRNVVLTTEAGSIEIESGGLSGAFNNLELIAKRLKVNGPILNSVTREDSRVRLVAGDSKAQIDTSVAPTNNLVPWISYESGTASNVNSVLVDITSLGSISAGRIQIAVTDQGAGVKHAGHAHATAGDFTLNASGKLEVLDGTIRAAKSIVALDRVDTDGAITPLPTFTMRGGELVSGMDTLLHSSSIRIEGGNISAGTDAQLGNVIIGLPGVTPDEDTLLAGRYTDGGYTPLTLTASAGIGVYAPRKSVDIDGARLNAAGSISLDGGDVQLQTQWVGVQAQRATLDSHSGSIVVSSAGAIRIQGGYVQGGALVQLDATRLRIEPASSNENVLAANVTSLGGSISLRATETIQVQGSDVAARQNVVTHSSSFSLEHANGRASTLNAVEGGVLVEASGDIYNIASAISGYAAVAGTQTADATVSLRAGGSITNESSDSIEQPAVIYSDTGDVVVQSAGDFLNRGARLLAARHLIITAGGDASNWVDYASADDHYAWERSSRNWLGIRRREAGSDISYGHLTSNHAQAFWKAGDTLQINARNISNRGGNIYADSGDIRLSAQGTIDNRALAVGEAHYTRSCRLVWCRTEAFSNVDVVGGQISAAGDIAMEAGTQIENLGGRVLALGDMTLSAPSIVAKGIRGYSARVRHQGMKAWFGDSWARIYAADVGGSYTATGGKLVIQGIGYNDGGSFSAANGVDAPSGIVVVRAAQRDPVSLDGSHLGLTSWLWE